MPIRAVVVAMSGDWGLPVSFILKGIAKSGNLIPACFAVVFIVSLIAAAVQSCGGRFVNALINSAKAGGGGY